MIVVVKLEKGASYRRCRCCFGQDEVMELHFQMHFDDAGTKSTHVEVVCLCAGCRDELRRALRDAL